MIPRAASGPAGPLPFTFLFAALITLLTGLLYTLLVDTLLPLGPRSFAPAHAFAIAVTFGNAIALGARRLGAPLRPALALCAPPASAWLVPFLLLPSLLLTSEIDNVLMALFPLPPPPEVTAEAAAQAAAVLPPGIELALGLVAFGVVQPIAFESFFRGLCLGRLARVWSGAQAVFATSLLSWSFSALAFAVLTQPPPARLLSLSVQEFGEALLLGVLRLRSGSLYPSLLLASLCGATRALSDQGAFRIPGFDDMSAPHTPASWLLPAVALTALGLWLCRRMAPES